MRGTFSNSMCTASQLVTAPAQPNSPRLSTYLPTISARVSRCGQAPSLGVQEDEPSDNETQMIPAIIIKNMMRFAMLPLLHQTLRTKKFDVEPGTMARCLDLLKCRYRLLFAKRQHFHLHLVHIWMIELLWSCSTHIALCWSCWLLDCRL